MCFVTHMHPGRKPTPKPILLLGMERGNPVSLFFGRQQAVRFCPYRAVDKLGRTVDFLLRPDRGMAAAQAFFREALASRTDHPPLKITLDGHWHSHRALRLLRREHAAWRRVTVRSSKYLNNIVEQDHRAIKQRCGPMRGFKSFANAAVTIAGIELAHRIHKHQFSFGRGRPRVGASLRTIWDQALTP